MRRDPARMVIRPLLRRLDVRLASNREDAAVRREIGLGAVAEYSVAELLGQSQYLYGAYEYVYKSAFLGQIAPGAVVLDIGANLGEYTLPAARATGPTGRVLAFEPNPQVRQRLLDNIELNGLSNVQVSPFALGSSDAEGTLTVPDGSPGLATLGSAAFPGITHRVPIRRLDDLLADEDLRRLTVMKLDVEGWELEVFEGARQTLAQARPVVLYECAAELFGLRGTRMATETMTYLESLEYRNYVVGMNRRGRWALRPVEATPDPSVHREPWTQLLVVAVHRQGLQRACLQGQSPLTRCHIFEMIGRTPSPRARQSR